MATKPHGKSPLTAGSTAAILPFKDIVLGPSRSEVRFRLIHFWDAVNPRSGTLFGVEMLIIDEEGTVMQGFIPSNRVQRYVRLLTRGRIYSLVNFYGSKNKAIYRVADHTVTVTFNYESVLSQIEDSRVVFEEDRFRFHTHCDFEANCGLQGDLYDVLGHMKLVNGQPNIQHPNLDDVETSSNRRLTVHIQSHEGPIMKLYLWDHAMSEFCQKFKSYKKPPNVLLVTTVNTKRIGGTLGLNTMASSRIFMDNDIKPTIEYLQWFTSNPDIADQVNAQVVTKAEMLSIGDIFEYMKQENAKVAYFECIAKINDVVHGIPWYYIGCSSCSTKATRGPTSLMCPKCGKANVTSVAQYRAKISVSDDTDEAVFVLLGDAGLQLTGKPASTLVESHFEANGSSGDEDHVPVPQALIGTIGGTHKFCFKVTEYNLTGKTQHLTVTKVISSATLPTATGSNVKHVDSTSVVDLEASDEVSQSSSDVVNQMSANTSATQEDERTKRPRIGT